MAEDGRERAEDAAETTKKAKQGGFRTMPFILANDFCDRLATVGFGSNLISYLTLQLHLPLVEASNVLTNYHGTTNLTPLVGGLIADSFAGRFWTITVGSIIYQLGMVCLTLSAALPSLRPPPCAKHAAECQRASTYQIAILYLSLLCTSIGAGGSRPCNMAFGADQLELGARRRRSANGGKAPMWSFFNLYFFGIELAKLTAVTVVVYIQENVGWGWGLGVPTIAMFVAVIGFVSGYSLYVKMPPGGSPLVRLAQVVAAAFKKRKTVLPDPDLLYEDKKLDAGISTTGRLLHTNQLKFFDKAAIVTEGDVLPSGEPKLWRLSTGLNLVYYFVCVKYYTFKPLETEVEHQPGHGNGTESAKKGAESAPLSVVDLEAKGEADDFLAKLLREEEIKWARRAKVSAIQFCIPVGLPRTIPFLENDLFEAISQMECNKVLGQMGSLLSSARNKINTKGSPNAAKLFEDFFGPQDIQWAKEVPEGSPDMGLFFSRTPGGPGAPRWVVPTSVASRIASLPYKFPNIPKTLEEAIDQKFRRRKPL
uniref:Peptide transporter PTR1 n=1 Tax=Aegilops tauschii TaxID=37682 RepID=R7W210_AEGTA